MFQSSVKVEKVVLRLKNVKSSWKGFEIYCFSCFPIQNFIPRSTMVADIFEEFEPPSKNFLATPLTRSNILPRKNIPISKWMFYTLVHRIKSVIKSFDICSHHHHHYYFWMFFWNMMKVVTTATKILKFLKLINLGKIQNALAVVWWKRRNNWKKFHYVVWNLFTLTLVTDSPTHLTSKYVSLIEGRW